MRRGGPPSSALVCCLLASAAAPVETWWNPELWTNGSAQRAGGCDVAAAPRRLRLSPAAVRETLQQGLSDFIHQHGLVGGVAAARLPGGGGTESAAAGWARLRSADHPEGTHMTTHSRLLLGSVTKPWTAALIMKLVDDGRVGLDDLIATHLPHDVVSHFEHGARTTIRHLLMMRSGMADYLPNTMQEALANPSKQWTPHERVMRAPHQAQFAPGTAGQYSNTNFALLGMVYSAVTGEDWRTLDYASVRTASVTDATIFPNQLDYDAAHGYAPPEGDQYHRLNPSMAVGDGNLVAPIADEASWIFELYGVGGVVSAGSMREMKTIDYTTRPAYGLGTTCVSTMLGFDTGPAIFGHGGSFPGYSSFVGYVTGYDFSLAVSINDQKLRQAEVDLFRHLYELLIKKDLALH